DVKGAKKVFSGGTSLSHNFNEMPKTDFADPYVIKKLSTGEPALGVNFGWRFKSSTAHLE
ncbi:hypothetical protein, partial [Pseudomonas fulva]